MAVETRERMSETIEELAADRAALEAVRGSSIEPAPETQLLDSILSVAVGHDTVSQFHEDRLYKQIGVREPSWARSGDDTSANDYTAAVVELCAAIAQAAIRRVPAIPAFAQALAGSGAIEELRGEALATFMRPIFEESGIGERFEVRTGYQVYRDAKDAQTN